MQVGCAAAWSLHVWLDLESGVCTSSRFEGVPAAACLIGGVLPADSVTLLGACADMADVPCAAGCRVRVATRALRSTMA